MKTTEREMIVRAPARGAELEGHLAVPEGARGVVVFAHGSGSSRHSPRNRFVSESLRERRLGALLIDLLTAEEERVDLQTRHLRFDIELLAGRLEDAAGWLAGQPETRGLSIGYFGASTGAGAALLAAARHPEHIGAIVSRGGRPDMADRALPLVKAPTLLIVGGDDGPVIELNEEAYRQLKCEKKMAIVPGASHLFEEPGTLEEVARLAGDWFVRHLG
jgi:dienelactone hydrolase